MKKKVIIITLHALIVSSFVQAAKQQTATNNNESACQTESEESRQQRELPPINERFLSYFPDMALGTYNQTRTLIPQNVAVEFLPDFVYPEDTNVKYFAVGKISNYKGLDLLVFDYEGERPDEDTYDNHTDGHRFLLLFKNEVSLTNKSNRGEIQRLSYTINYHYSGEGGEALYKSYFDADTTIITHSYSSESESATGCIEPLVSTKEYRWGLNEKGEQNIIEVRQIEYSSPFYDRHFLKEQDWTWFEKNNIRAFPTKDEKWGLDINNSNYDNFTLFSPQVDLYFYLEKIDGEYIPVFESYINKNLIDRYSVGLPHNDIKTERNYVARTNILKCPIIIKTSDGDLELLPSGKLRIRI